MPTADRVLGMYLHLARASTLRRQPLVRDRMLVLAGVTAAEMGLADISAACRRRVLAHNAQHMLRNWDTVGDALGDPRFLTYLRGLRRRCSPEKAEHLLHTLGVEWANERGAYYSDEEYAAALLAATPENIAPSGQSRESPAGHSWTPSRGRWLWLSVAAMLAAGSLAWALWG
jgi:hypothetical protein